MDEIKIKQQAIERIKKAEKILVTVSDSPSVDELSAALGLALLLEKQGKYATAIFSGQTPPAIAFLEPEKTFDDTTDSLRDFIIALNKEKADHLRYKVVDDAVKIFITPYKTTITEADLEYSQGDYNVELVIALGVDDQDHLDTALESHGQILHDADIITMTASDKTSDLGGIDWHDAQASSLSEMVAGLAEALKQDKSKSLLDAPIATALLTGIVAQTDRFSNEHTTSKAMTVSATLMAAGADQQLIATELQESHEIPTPEEEPNETTTEDTNDTDDSDSSGGVAPEVNEAPKPPKDKSQLTITHDKETLADLDKRVMGDKKAKEKVEAEIEAVEEEAEQAAETNEAPSTPLATDVQNPMAESAFSSAYTAPSEHTVNEAPADTSDEPVLGGTLNATTEQAADDARRAIENDQNKTILSHSFIGQSAQESANTNASVTPTNDAQGGFPGTPVEVPGSEDASTNAYGVVATPAEEAPQAGSMLADALTSAPAAPSSPVAFGGERVIEPLPHEQPAVEQVPVEPVASPAPMSAYGLPLPPPLPDFSQGTPASPAAPGIPLPSASQQPELLGDILAPEPAPFAAQPSNAYAPVPEAPAAPAAQPTDPGQFKIPGQQ